MLLMPRSNTPKQTPEQRGAQSAREQLYRTLIIDAAQGLFAEKGVEATKMEEISEAAGLSLTTVYAVLRGKLAILDAIHEARMSEAVASAEVAAAAAHGPLDMLVAGVRAFARYFIAHPEYLRIHLADERSWAIPITGGSGKARAWEQGYAMQVRLFEQGIEEGVFHPDDPRQLADMLIAIQQVRLAHWLGDGMQGDSEEVVARMELQLRRAFCTRAEDRGET